jgi:hypothetical protein
MEKKPKRGHKKADDGQKAGQGAEKPSAGRATARSLVKKAYRKLSERMESEDGNGKAITELGKLVKIEKEIIGETRGGKGAGKFSVAYERTTEGHPDKL